MLALLALWWTLVAVAIANDAPSPMSFDDFELAAEESEAPARAAQRARRVVEIDGLATRTEQDQRMGTLDVPMALKLAHLLHLHGRETADSEAVRRAVTLYERVLAEPDPSVPRTHVTFHLGFALASLRDPRSDAVLAAVTRAEPTSPYAAHASLHLGEASFERGEYRAAVDHYAHARGEDFPFADFALYKLAWAEYRNGDAVAAIQTMQRAVAEARPRLVRTALDAVTYWASAHGVALADADRQRLVTRSFGDCRDDFPGWTRDIADRPMATAAFEATLRMAECRHSLSMPHQSDLQSLHARFGPRSAWWRAQDASSRRQARAARRDIRRWPCQATGGHHRAP